MENAPKVSSLFVYPIKSCRGISVSQAPVTPTGLRWDRSWLVVNSKGRAYTQRVEPKLALVEVELPKEAFLENWEPTRNSFLVVKAPGMDVLKIPMTKPSAIAEGVSMWEWSGSAFDEGEQAARWFSNYIGKPSRLVRFNTGSETRPVNPEFAPGHFTTFADLFPFLLASQGSLDGLNKLLDEPVKINRFRPNIFVDGCEPFEEDLWKEIRINNFIFEGVKLCNRCKVPLVDQETGIPGTEPNETLMKFRSDKILLPNRKHQGKTYFGVDMVWKDNTAPVQGKILKIGDPIFVLEKLSSAAEAPA